jgi:tetratricopeptide (TPR) repeat protein
LLLLLVAGFWALRELPSPPDLARIARDIQQAATAKRSQTLASGAFDDDPYIIPAGQQVTSASAGELAAPNPVGMDARALSLNQDGVSLFKRGDTEGALEKLEEAYFRLPDNPLIARNFSNVLTHVVWENLKTKRYDEALRRFDRALGVDDENVEALKGSGFSRIRLKETDAAVRDFDEAHRLSPGDVDAGLALAQLLYQGDELVRAKSVLVTLLRENPENVRARKLMKRVVEEDKVEREFQANDTGHFRLKFDISENAALGAVVSAILEEAYTLIGGEFHHFPADPTVVILYTKEQFRSVSRLPHWSRGVYDGKIRIPVGGVNERTEELEDVIFHEYTHVVVNHITRGRCPTWLNEGLAQYKEPSADGGKRALLRTLRRVDLVPLSLLEGSFLKLPGDAARTAYAQAYAAVLYVAETYSFYHLRSILERIGAGDKPEEALRKVLHYGYPSLQTGIADYLRRFG